MTQTLAVVLSLALIPVAVSGLVIAYSNDSGAEVLALEKEAMERWAKGDPDGFLELLDEDIVFFDPSLTSRADGLETVRRLYENERGRINEVHFINPKVQLAGDCAVLTFNLITRERSGERRERRWHATEVLQRRQGRWKIIHQHYSLAKEDSVGRN